MIFAKDKRVFFKIGFTDMRKQIKGLSAIAQVGLPESPFSGSYFVFYGKTRKIMKILYWDNTGFCLWQKRLEEALFPWQPADEPLNELVRSQLKMVLRGIDVFAEYKRLSYTHVA